GLENTGTITLDAAIGSAGSSNLRVAGTLENAGIIQSLSTNSAGTRTIQIDEFVNSGTLEIAEDTNISAYGGGEIYLDLRGGTVNIAAGKTLNVTASGVSSGYV